MGIRREKTASLTAAARFLDGHKRSGRDEGGPTHVRQPPQIYCEGAGDGSRSGGSATFGGETPPDSGLPLWSK